MDIREGEKQVGEKKNKNMKEYNSKMDDLIEKIRIFKMKSSPFRAVHSNVLLVNKHDRAPVVQEKLESVCKHYKFEEVLGRGSSGCIRRCIEKCSGQIRACKTIPKSSIRHVVDLHSLRLEIATLKLMQDHPAVVRLHGVFEDNLVSLHRGEKARPLKLMLIFFNQCVHIVMEYCEGGDLFSAIEEKGFFSEKEAAAVIKTLASVLSHAHRKGILHRDLKPENVLLLSKDSITDVRLADFGSATVLKKGTSNNFSLVS